MIEELIIQIENDPKIAEAIDEYNYEENLKALQNFNPNKPITFKTRGGDLIVDKSAKTGLLRTTPEDAPFPEETNISFEKFEQTIKQNPKQIALFFAKQNLFEDATKLEMDNKEEEL